jgi:hypothetical protein
MTITIIREIDIERIFLYMLFMDTKFLFVMSDSFLAHFPP